MTAEEYAAQVIADLKDTWLPNIYRRRIRAERTRAYHFSELTTKGRVEIQHTLLGVELKAGRRRFLCPDLATARYLSVFARAGCKTWRCLTTLQKFLNWPTSWNLHGIGCFFWWNITRRAILPDCGAESAGYY